jgi:hypothetical protein
VRKRGKGELTALIMGGLVTGRAWSWNVGTRTLETIVTQLPNGTMVRIANPATGRTDIGVVIDAHKSKTPGWCIVEWEGPNGASGGACNMRIDTLTILDTRQAIDQARADRLGESLFPGITY